MTSLPYLPPSPFGNVDATAGAFGQNLFEMPQDALPHFLTLARPANGDDEAGGRTTGAPANYVVRVPCFASFGATTELTVDEERVGMRHEFDIVVPFRYAASYKIAAGDLATVFFPQSNTTQTLTVETSADVGGLGVLTKISAYYHSQ